MQFEAYFNALKNKKVAVCGLGVSNLPLIRLLRARGINVEARDRKSVDDLGEDAQELEALGVKLVCGADYLVGIDADVIFRSPGMMPHLPQFVEATHRGAVLTSEMEAFFEVCPCRIIGITGSDGKTTTSSVIAEMLKTAGFKTWLGGNIGTPLLDRVPELQPDDYVVLELSSFQLMNMTKSPDIAVVTNVSPNHLDIHKDMEEYIEAKRNIFKYQSASGKVVLNFDNEITRSFGIQVRKQGDGSCASFPGEKGSTRTVPLLPCFFSSKVGLDRMPSDANAVYLNGNAIVVSEGDKTEEIMLMSDIRLIGMHNVENYMAAIGALYGIVPSEVMVQVARTFAGVEHRSEFVRELDGVKYYNDSIASSPTRTIAGLQALSHKVILIAGGYDKHIPYEPLAEAVPDHVKALILLGATKPKIRAAVENLRKGSADAAIPPIYEVDTLEDAVTTARSISEAGDIVFFSPASASFDMFKNFEVRGNTFKQLVLDL